jgi:hypothetical protein
MIMRAKRLLAITAWLVVAVGLTSSAYALEVNIDWKKGKLERLLGYIGTMDYEAVLADPYVASELQFLLGDKITLLKRNLQVRVSIAFIDSYFILDGVRPHEANKDRAFVAIDNFNGNVIAAIFTKGKYTVYSRDKNRTSGDPIYTPDPLMDWLHSDEIQSITERYPWNFEWIHRAEPGD